MGSLGSEYAEAYYILGRARLESNKPDLAALDFMQAIKLNPNYPSAHNELGVAWGQLGDVAQAEACFARAVELSPSFVDAQVNLDRARKMLRGAQATK